MQVLWGAPECLLPVIVFYSTFNIHVTFCTLNDPYYRYGREGPIQIQFGMDPHHPSSFCYLYFPILENQKYTPGL